MTERDRRARDERDRLPNTGQPVASEPAPAEPSARQADPRLPVPFVPRFAWRPDAADFPILLSAPGRAIPKPQAGPLATRQAALDPEWPRVYPALDESGVYRDRPRFLPYVIVALLVVGVSAAYLWQRGDGDTVTPTRSAQTQSTPTSGSILGTAPTQLPEGGGSQVPGQGGARPVTPPAGSTPVEGTATEPVEEPIDEPTSEPEAPVEEPVTEAGIVTITVPEGLTTLNLSENTGLSVATLIWANPSISDPHAPIPTELEVDVPPTDGVIHTIAEGQTLEQIAATYGVTADDIIAWEPNAVAEDADLVAGARIVVRGGRPECRATLGNYTVLENDNLWQIAEYYGVDQASVAYANELPGIEMIHPGQQLIIPPGNGVLVTVAEGDSVESIAGFYGVDPARVRACAFNGLAGDGQPAAGAQLMVPGVDPSQLGGSADSAAASGAGEPSPTDESAEPVYDPFVATPTATPEPQATGDFIWPAAGNVTTEFSSAHNGIDVANSSGTPVVASDSGVVTFAGWNDNGLGYTVGIDHENGYVTWYGHLSDPPSVAVGQRVAQGEYLGPMGSTGKSTGPHLHFILIQDGVYQDALEILPRG